MASASAISSSTNINNPTSTSTSTSTPTSISATALTDLAAPFPALTPAQLLQKIATYAKEQEGKLEQQVQQPQQLSIPSSTSSSSSSIPLSISPLTYDVYGNGSFLSHFESHLSTLLGKESGLFFCTGIMAQLVAIKLHSHMKNPIVALHPLSHLHIHEQKAYEAVFGLSACLIGSATTPISLIEVEKAITSHWKQPSCLIIELPERELGGQTLSWDELVQINKFCHSRSIHLHMDGARLWEIAPYYNRSYAEICSLFDSVYVSFYKGLGGSTGAMLFGSSSFISEAKIWQRRMGGNMYMQLPYIVDAQRCFNMRINTFTERWEKLKIVVEQLKQQETIRIAVEEEKCKSNSSSDRNSKSVLPVYTFQPSIPHCSMVHMHLRCSTSIAEVARDAVKRKLNILLFDRIRSSTATGCYWEWKMGTENGKIEVDKFVQGWRLFAEIITNLNAR